MGSNFRKSRDASDSLFEINERENVELAKSIISSFYSSLFHVNRDKSLLTDVDGDNDGDNNEHDCHYDKPVNCFRGEVDFQQDEEFLEYFDDFWMLKVQRKRHVKQRAPIKTTAGANEGRIRSEYTKNRISIPNVKLSKYQRKNENKSENLMKRKRNIERRLVKLGLRRNNEDPCTAKKAPETENKFIISMDSSILGSKTRRLASLQYREISPNDYDLLLALDDTILPKTVSKKVLEKFETRTVPVWMKDENYVCCICFEMLSNEMKELPSCGHCFHGSCIDTWLGTASNVCPIDQQVIS